MSIEIQEGPGGATVFYAHAVSPDDFSCIGHLDECYVVRRLRPNETPQSLFGASATGLWMPHDLRLAATGQLLIAEYGHRTVSSILFGENPAQGEPAVVPFAGNGEFPADTRPAGPATSTAIGKPEGISIGPEGFVYVSCERSGAPDLAVRVATEINDGTVVPGFLSTVFGAAVATPMPEGPPELVDGLDALKAEANNIAGVAWHPGNGALLLGVGESGEVWKVAGLPLFADRRFTRINSRSPTAEDPTRWILDEGNGTQHRFDATGRHLRSLDRWGNERSYTYNDLGNLEAVNWPGGSKTVFSYVGNHVQTASLVPAGGGNGPVVTFEIDGSGDLVSLVSGVDFKRQFEYDESHRLVARYHGTAVTPPARYVEYAYEHGMVDSVIFHDTGANGQPVPEVVNRTYTHSREHGLVNANPGFGSPENPIAVAQDVGWDSVVDAAGIETLTRLDRQGRTLEVRRITGAETARTVYERNASGFISRMCYYGSEESFDCDYEETYEYDQEDNLTTVIVHDPEGGPSSEWSYYYAVGEQAVEDHSVPFTLGTMVVNPEGELLSRTHDDYGNLTELHHATAWHMQSGVPVVDSAHTARWSYGEEHPEYGLPIAAYDPVCMAKGPEAREACKTVFTYDNRRNLKEVDPADESYTELTRDPARGWVTGITEPVFVGGNPGQLAEAEWTIQRDDWGRPKAVSGPSTGTTNLNWTDPLTGAGCASCSAGDKLSEVVGPAPGGGQTARPLTKYAYDLAGRLLRTQTGYRMPGQPPLDTPVRSVLYVRDPAGRVTGMQVEGTQTDMSAIYDEDSGLLGSLSVALGGGQSLDWTYQHDLLDRPSLVVAPDGGQWQYDYDFLSGVTQVQETVIGRTTRFERDSVGRMTRRILDDGVTQTPETDPLWSYAYDAVGQFVKLQDPTETPLVPNDGNGTTLQRDEAGQVTKIRRDGQTVDDSGRDEHNRTAQVSRTTGGLETRYNFEYNAASALSSIRASWWQIGTPATETLALKHLYLYDEAGRPAAVEAWHETPGHWATAPQLSMSYHYDEAGRLDEVAVVAPSTAPGTSLQGRVALARDSAGRLERMDFLSPDQQQQYLVRKRTVVTYQPASSRLAGIRTGAPVPNSNAVTTPYLVDLAYFYDPAGRITAQETGTVGQQGWWKRSYSYDPASRLTEAKDFVPSTENPMPWLNRWAWTYNTAGERTSQTVQFDLPGETPPQTSTDEGYSWDAYGVLERTYLAGDPQQPTLDSFTFDAAGNLQTLAQADGTTLSFTYDPSGRTKTVTVGGTGDGTVVTYRYGPDERLTERTVDLLGNGSIDIRRRYFSDGLISWEIDGTSGNLLRAFVFLPDGFTPLMIVAFDAPPTSPPDPPAPQPGTIYFVHNDHLSTPKAVTDLTGTPVWLARHAPFGQVQELCGGANGTPDPAAPPGPCTFDQPLRFPGQWDQKDAHLTLAGLWYNWHRFYLPGWGMYSRRDPIVRADGREFGYANSSPSFLSDFSGLYIDGWMPGGDAGITEGWDTKDSGGGSAKGDHATVWGGIAAATETAGLALLLPFGLNAYAQDAPFGKEKDKLLHCWMNCQMTQAGLGPLAPLWSFLQEWAYDLCGHPAELTDMWANNEGEKAGQSSRDCFESCAEAAEWLQPLGPFDRKWMEQNPAGFFGPDSNGTLVEIPLL